MPPKEELLEVINKEDARNPRRVTNKKAQNVKDFEVFLMPDFFSMRLITALIACCSGLLELGMLEKDLNFWSESDQAKVYVLRVCGCSSSASEFLIYL
jgi:hypothetical protein